MADREVLDRARELMRENKEMSLVEALLVMQIEAAEKIEKENAEVRKEAASLRKAIHKAAIEIAAALGNPFRDR